MAVNRLWQFNPGCIDQPCCGSTPNPTPCCTTWDCGETFISSQTLTLTNRFGTITLYPKWTRSGFGGTAPITGWEWFGVQRVTEARTTKTWWQSGVDGSGNPMYVQNCSEIQEGQVWVAYRAACQANAPGRIGTLQESPPLMHCGVGWDTSHASGGDGHYYAMRDTYNFLYTDLISGQSWPTVGHLSPEGEEEGYQGVSTTGAGSYGTYFSEDATTLKFDMGAPNLDTQSAGFVRTCLIGGIVTISKPIYNPSGISNRLLLNDGLGDVQLIYNGPRPVSLGTATDMWWGCTTRSCSTARHKASSGDCEATDVTIDVPVVFGLWCKGPSEGYRLYIFHGGCGSYDDGINVQTHMGIPLTYITGNSGATREMTSDEWCVKSWLGQYNQIVAGSINGIGAQHCNPFVWGPHSQSFPVTPYPYHPLRGIYGDSATWMIVDG